MKITRQKTDFSVMYILKIGQRDFMLGGINTGKATRSSELLSEQEVQPVARKRDRFCNTGCGAHRCRKARHA